MLLLSTCIIKEVKCLTCAEDKGYFNPLNECRDRCRTDSDCDNGICSQNTEGNYDCLTTTCIDDTECNGGKCITFPDQESKSCFCPISQAGIFCELVRSCDHKDVPNQRPCLNGGMCISGDSEKHPGVPYTCDCKNTYFTGFYCENMHPCHPMKVCETRNMFN